MLLKVLYNQTEIISQSHCICRKFSTTGVATAGVTLTKLFPTTANYDLLLYIV